MVLYDYVIMNNDMKLSHHPYFEISRNLCPKLFQKKFKLCPKVKGNNCIVSTTDKLLSDNYFIETLNSILLR